MASYRGDGWPTWQGIWQGGPHGDAGAYHQQHMGATSWHHLDASYQRWPDQWQQSVCWDVDWAVAAASRARGAPLWVPPVSGGAQASEEEAGVMPWGAPSHMGPWLGGTRASIAAAKEVSADAGVNAHARRSRKHRSSGEARGDGTVTPASGRSSVGIAARSARGAKSEAMAAAESDLDVQRALSMVAETVRGLPGMPPLDVEQSMRRGFGASASGSEFSVVVPGAEIDFILREPPCDVDGGLAAVPGRVAEAIRARVSQAGALGGSALASADDVRVEASNVWLCIRCPHWFPITLRFRMAGEPETAEAQAVAASVQSPRVQDASEDPSLDLAADEEWSRRGWEPDDEEEEEERGDEGRRGRRMFEEPLPERAERALLKENLGSRSQAVPKWFQARLARSPECSTGHSTDRRGSRHVDAVTDVAICDERAHTRLDAPEPEAPSPPDGTGGAPIASSRPPPAHPVDSDVAPATPSVRPPPPSLPPCEVEALDDLGRPDETDRPLPCGPPPPPPVPPAPRAPEPPAGPSEALGGPVFAAGDQVCALFYGEWHPATVWEVDGERVTVKWASEYSISHVLASDVMHAPPAEASVVAPPPACHHLDLLQAPPPPPPRPARLPLQGGPMCPPTGADGRVVPPPPPPRLSDWGTAPVPLPEPPQPLAAASRKVAGRPIGPPPDGPAPPAPKGLLGGNGVDAGDGTSDAILIGKLQPCGADGGLDLRAMQIGVVEERP